MKLTRLLNSKQTRFVLIGAFNTAWLYGLYVLLIYLGMNYNLALVVDYLIGILVGFYLNRRITFSSNNTGSTNQHFDLRQFKKYFATYIFAFSLNLLLLNALVLSSLLDPFRAQLLAVILTTLCSFILQDKWVFAAKSNGNGS